MPTKDELRRSLRRRRRAVADRTALEAAIAGRIDELANRYGPPSLVAAYAAAGGEASINGWIERACRAGRVVALPVCVGEADLAWFRCGGLDELAAGRHGIREPSEAVRHDPARRVELREIAAVLVPGVAFAPDGGRLGQGGGYYDRFLPRWRDAVGDRGLALGIAFETQIVDALPGESHDRPVDVIATETRVIDCRAVRGTRVE